MTLIKFLGIAIPVVLLLAFVIWLIYIIVEYRKVVKEMQNCK